MAKQPEHTAIALIAQDVTYIKAAIDEFKEQYVSKQEFDPIKRIVYGGVGLILIAVVGVGLDIIFRK